MTTFIHLGILFFAKMLDNALGTAKTILVQRNRCILAGIALALSNYIYFCITRNIDHRQRLAIIVVSSQAVDLAIAQQQTFKGAHLCQRHHVR